MSTFRPKQITEYKASDMEELVGGTSEEVTAASLCLLPETIKPDAIIHDAACGSAPATSVLMEQHPPTISIHATDINPAFIEGVAATAKEKDWLVTAAVMDVKKLEFPDDKFTHTFFTFSCPLLKAGGAAETYRTLKPGGICVATTPTYLPHIGALCNTHRAIRGADAPLPPFLRHEYTTDTLVDGLLSGGFAREKIAVHETKATMVVPDAKRWIQLAWSYVATPEGGWIPEDEVHWDEAIAMGIKELEKQPGVSRNGDGHLLMTMNATIAIATK